MDSSCAPTQHPSVRAGYHMNNDPWNTITIDRRVLDEELAEWISASCTPSLLPASHDERELRSASTRRHFPILDALLDAVDAKGRRPRARIRRLAGARVPARSRR